MTSELSLSAVMQSNPEERFEARRMAWAMRRAGYTRKTEISLRLQALAEWDDKAQALIPLSEALLELIRLADGTLGG